MTDALDRAHFHVREWLDSLPTRPVGARASAAALRATLSGPLPETGGDAAGIIDALVANASEGLHANAGGRFFGWVMAGSLPSALAADWLVSAWDQNAGMFTVAPATCMIEEIAGNWLKQLFVLPETASFAFTTGCQMAHVTALAAARHGVLKKAGWNVEEDGLFGAPRIRVLTSDNRHRSVDSAIRYLGLGQASLHDVAINPMGDMSPDDLENCLGEWNGPTILCLNAADLNVGTFDDFRTLIPMAQAAGAWVHIDGAFGLFARTSERLKHLTDGIDLADSWATDGHKWLNVPYDCGFAFVRDAEVHRAAMALGAAYLSPSQEVRDPTDWNLELSRRARAVPVYAALQELGRQGVGALVERSCDHCRAIVNGIGALPNARALNDPALNQGLVRFEREGMSVEENDRFTDEIIHRVNESGEAFFSGTTWHGQRVMRVSVVSWRTEEADVARTIAAVAAGLAAAE
ncbi:MAG: aminotransferase class V-fold PLP-dependent enzyme [Hyphomonas sp.]